MPGALTWDPDRNGGPQTTWRGQANADAPGVTAVPGDGDFSVSTASRLPRWRKALGDAMAGIADARVSVIGDSTTGGVTTGGTWAKAPAAVAARCLAGFGLPVNANAMWGDTNRGQVPVGTFDPRITLGSGWSSTGGGFSSIGGSTLQNTSGSGTLSFTPVDPVTGLAYVFDTIDVYYARLTAGGGSFAVGVDGGAAIGAAVATTGSRSLQVATRTTTLATHTVNVTATAAGNVYIIGIVCSNSTQKAIRLWNHGGGSYRAVQDYTMGTLNDYTVLAAITNNTLAAPLAPHLSIVDIAINDRRLAAYSSAFDTALHGMVTRLQTVDSDVVLCIPVASALANSAFTTQENQDAYDAAIRRIASENGLPVWDKRARFGTYEAMQPLGYYADQLHPTPAAYAVQGLDLAQIIRDW